MRLIELYKSVQGESSFTGVPCIFVRFAGCNLRCAWCDSAFTFTGGHLHASSAEEGYRRFLTNGVLWAAGVEVPKGGAKVDLDAKALGEYLTPAPPKKK